MKAPKFVILWDAETDFTTYDTLEEAEEQAKADANENQEYSMTVCQLLVEHSYTKPKPRAQRKAYCTAA